MTFRNIVICGLFIFITTIAVKAEAYTDYGEVPSGWGVWSCWYWPWHNSTNPNLYDNNEAMQRYDNYVPNVQAQIWEYNYHGPNQNPEPWWGHCHAWAAASCWEAQPSQMKTLSNVNFRIRDRKGLMIEAYDESANGSNYELYVNDPSPGLFWRYLRKELRGDDAMHGHGMAFIGELYYGPEEIWNHPIYKYQVYFEGSAPYSGTIKIWVATDISPNYADSTTLYYQTYTYQFQGVMGDGSNPVDSGTWIGTGPYHRPDCIWRPYVAKSWVQYAENTELRWTYLNKILWPKEDAYEENDSISAAYDISTRERVWLENTNGLGIQADEDWYRIYVNSGYQRVYIYADFLNVEGDIDISLYNSLGQRLAVSETYTDGEIIDYIVSSGGTYYIRVYYGNQANTYDLWWDDLQP